MPRLLSDMMLGLRSHYTPQEAHDRERREGFCRRMSEM
jgi:hypothetical protein